MGKLLIGNVKGPQGATGPQGEQGNTGNAATVTVGTTSTTAYGNPAQVTNVGTPNDAILNFRIPQGAPGATVTQMDNLALNTITTATDQYPQIQVGDLGRVIFGKIIKFFQDLVTGLATKVNYSDALTMEEIEAASDLTDKVSAAAASNTLKDALTYKLAYDGADITPKTLPTGWKEAIVWVAVSATNGVMYSFHVLSAVPLTQVVGYQVAQAGFTYAQITSSATTVTFDSGMYQGASYTPLRWVIWYR